MALGKGAAGLSGAVGLEVNESNLELYNVRNALEGACYLEKSYCWSVDCNCLVSGPRQ